MSLRSRSFWYYLYLLEVAQERSDAPAGFGSHPDTRSTEDLIAINSSVELRLALPNNAALVFSIGPAGAGLHIRDSMTSGLLGWLDADHPMPHIFRWSEVNAIANALEANGLPNKPSLARLLLAPFSLVTPDEDQTAIGQELVDDLIGLDLLTLAEIDAARDLIMMHPNAEGRYATWTKAPTVGWALYGTMQGDPLFHSLRQPDNPDFPAALFTATLRACGVEDVD